MADTYLEIKTEIESSHAVVKSAISEKATALRFALRNLGKRCSERWVYLQGDESRDIIRRNFHSVYKLWIGAFILSGNMQGAEILLNDLEMFVRRCRAALVVNPKPKLLGFPIEQNHIVNQITKIMSDVRELKYSIIGED